MLPVFLNGRFLNQTLTGVQRFSAEILAAIAALAAAGDWPETTVLVPAGHAPGTRLRQRPVGRLRGHLWEQAELPRAARGGVLVSLGNTAPVLAGRRQVVVIHDAGVFDTPESYSLRFRTWYKMLQHGLARSGARIVTVSAFSRARIAARLGLDPDRIAVMHEGADHILRAPADTTILTRHGLFAGRFAVVVGNRVAHKNLGALQGVASVLARRGIGLAMAGGRAPGVYQAPGEDRMAGPDLGRVSDAALRALYENAVCLLFPSRYEGFGLPPVEAMACGCPVLAFGGGAVEEICGDAALYFPPGDAAIGRSVERLLDEDGLAAHLRTRGLARAQALSWEASARKLGHAVRQVR